MADLRVLHGVKIVDADTVANSVTVTASGELLAVLGANADVNIGDIGFLAADQDTDDDIIAGAQLTLRTLGLAHGWDGSQWERLTTDAAGSLDVNVTLALPVGSNIIGLVGGDEVDNAAVSVGGSVLMSGMVFDDTTPVVVTEGDAGYQRMSADREAYIINRDAAGNERGANVTAANELNVLATAQPGVDIGDVDILSVLPGFGNLNLGKAENVAIAAGDVGVATMAVQDAVLSALGSVDDDYTQLRVNANGALWVETVGASGGTSAVDDAPFTAGTDSFTPMGGMFDDTAPNDLEENDAGVVRMSTKREMYTNIRDGAGNERSANVTAAFEVNVLASAQPGVDIGDVTVLDFGAAQTDNDDDVVADSQTALRVINLMYGHDGTQWERIQTDAGGAMDVNVVAGGGEALPANPVRTTGASSDTAAAATFVQAGPESGGTTTTVRGFDASASVPIKAELQTVEDGTPTTILVMFALAGERLEWRAPHRDFFDVAHPANAGLDGFQLTITNLDNENAANLYATLYTED